MLNYRNTNFVFFTILLLLLISSFFVTINWWWFVVLFAVRFLILIIGSSQIELNFHLKAHCNNPLEKEKKIALTFDDGPSEFTPQVLEILNKNNVKATFFCIGKNIEKHPKILKQIFDAGHIIGNHSYNHSRFFDFYRKNRIVDEIINTNAIIEKQIGKNAAFFRPPFGVTNPSIKRALQDTKHKVIGWNIRSLDGIARSEKFILNRIKNRIKPGGIVILHDVSQNSVAVLEQLLLFLEENKYKVVSLEQLLNIKAYED